MRPYAIILVLLTTFTVYVYYTNDLEKNRYVLFAPQVAHFDGRLVTNFIKETPNYPGWWVVKMKAEEKQVRVRIETIRGNPNRCDFVVRVLRDSIDLVQTLSMTCRSTPVTFVLPQEHLPKKGQEHEYSVHIAPKSTACDETGQYCAGGDGRNPAVGLENNHVVRGLHIKNLSAWEIFVETFRGT